MKINKPRRMFTMFCEGDTSLTLSTKPIDGVPQTPVLVSPLTRDSVRQLDDKVWELIHGYTECGARRSSQLSRAILAALGITV